ncbi:MAG: PorT family protein [Microscillaceae bacterium]|jgi:hypothetical protein|nr:PorT family protein [Microscillaceae bacterium]
MKKNILASLVILLSLGFLSSVSAQDDETFSLGFKGGLNGSFIGKIPDKVERDGVLPGFVGGIYARFHTSGGTNLFFQPELVFSQTGARGRFSNTTALTTTTGEFRTTLNNIDVPFLVGVRLGIKGVGIRINGGPMMSYAFGATRKLTGTTTVSQAAPIALDLKEDIKSEINQFQAGFQAGVGVDLGAINLDLRYQYNFTKLYKDGLYTGTNYNIPQGDSQIRAVQLTVGFKVL